MGFPIAVLTFATAAVLLAVGCAGCAGGSTTQESSKTLRGYGVTVKIPAHWEGKVNWPSPTYARTVHIASFPLPPSLDGRGHKAERRMSSGDVYINMGIDPTFTTSSPLPLRIKRSALQTEWEGKVAEAAVRASTHARVHGRSIQIWVTFGSIPTDSRLAQVNRVLSTLTTRPPSPDP